MFKNAKNKYTKIIYFQDKVIDIYSKKKHDKKMNIDIERHRTMTLKLETNR